MTNATQRRIARERRRRREERFNRILGIFGDVFKIAALMVCSTVFAGVLVFIIEGNIHRFALMFELLPHACLHLLDYRLFIKGRDE